jgi:hypothetical protein
MSMEAMTLVACITFVIGAISGYTLSEAIRDALTPRREARRRQG